MISAIHAASAWLSFTPAEAMDPATAVPIHAARGPDRRWLVLGALAWLSLHVLLLWLYYEPTAKPLIGDEYDYNRRALALLAGTPGAETFIWPPGQTWFIAAIYALAGQHLLAVQVAQIVLLAICTLLLVRLCRTLADPRAAWVAGALFALNPATLAHAHWLWPEVTHLACLLGALCLLSTPRRYMPLRAFAAGGLIGLALLFKSLLGVFWPILLLAYLRGDHTGRSFAWTPALAFVGGLLLATSPALWKGYAETGRPLIADSSIYNLHVGLRDMSRSDYIDEAGAPALKAFIDSAPTPHERNSAYFDKIVALAGQRGAITLLAERLGVQYFRLFNAKTLLVSQLPGPACSGRLGAYSNPFPAPVIAGASHIAHATTLALAAFGIVLWRRWRAPLALFSVAFIAYQLALYLGLHVMQRYLFQMLPFLCIFGGLLLAVLVQRARARRATTVAASVGDLFHFSAMRLVAGLILAAALLCLAFLGPVLDGACR